MVQIYVLIHKSADDFLKLGYAMLRQQQIEANLILPYALERARDPRAYENAIVPDGWEDEIRTRGSQPGITNAVTPGALWITLWSVDGADQTQIPCLDLSLSCVEAQPICLYAHERPENLTPTYLEARIPALCTALAANQDPARVFAVFGVLPLTMAFASSWANHTGISLAREPSYFAQYTRLDPSLFISSANSLPLGHVILQPDERHLEQVTVLLESFSQTTRYPTAMPRAREEAQSLITRGQAWIYTVTDSQTSPPTIRVCALVVMARTSPDVTAVTKVFTVVTERQRGFTKRLLARACEAALSQHKTVVLFVAHGNVVAARLFGGIGFVGVGGRPGASEDWIEYEFDGTQRGDW